MKTSLILLQFYSEYIGWVDNGANPAQHGEVIPVFSRGCGLCTNLYDWIYRNFNDPNLSDALLDEMHDQFKDSGLHVSLPFNASSGGDEIMPFYREEAILDICHKNPRRLQWVQDRLKENNK